FLPRPGEPVEAYAERLRALHRDLSLVLEAVERGVAASRAQPPAGHEEEAEHADPPGRHAPPPPSRASAVPDEGREQEAPDGGAHPARHGASSIEIRPADAASGPSPAGVRSDDPPRPVTPGRRGGLPRIEVVP